MGSEAGRAEPRMNGNRGHLRGASRVVSGRSDTMRLCGAASPRRTGPVSSRTTGRKAMARTAGVFDWPSRWDVFFARRTAVRVVQRWQRYAGGLVLVAAVSSARDLAHDPRTPHPYRCCRITFCRQRITKREPKAISVTYKSPAWPTISAVPESMVPPPAAPTALNLYLRLLVGADDWEVDAEGADPLAHPRSCS